MKRFVGAVVTTLLLGAPLGVPAAAQRVPHEHTPPRFDYDDFLTGHLRYPAARRADRFEARQAATGTRARAASYQGDYGHPGCTPPDEYEVGTEREFWVAQNQTGNQQITAVLAAKSPHGYLWVQREFYVPADTRPSGGGVVTTAEAEAALERWESIYAIDRRYFGVEPNPNSPAQNLAPGLPADWRDADCDIRISILNFPIDAPGANGSTSYIAGYYSSEHEFPNGDGEHESPFSNETEMFFMNSGLLDVGGDTYSGVIAHEFYHMIQFSNDYNEETWVNEGMADIAAMVNGFGDIVDGHMSAYQDDPDQSLFYWGGDVSDYGQAVLFFDYLFTHYGARENEQTDALESYIPLAEAITKTEADGSKGITAALKARSGSELGELDGYYQRGNFKKVFKDWLVALYLDDATASHGQFGYKDREVKVAAEGSGDSSADDATVHAFGGEWYDLDGNGFYSATAEDPVAVIPATEGQPKPAGGYFAWSNRGDELLSWLERGADLTDAGSARLTFRYWYQIEEDWDYAYVRVSTDGGNSYEFVPTPDCGGRATDPNGNNRAAPIAAGMTGDSEGWKRCTLDLSAYAGGPALIRFEYDTDQAVNEAGFAVDDVKLLDGDRIIWRKNNFEKASRSRSWDFGGNGLLKWRRLRPLAKNKPLFQIVRVDGSKVTRKVLTRRAFERAGGKLVLRKDQSIAGNKAILIFSATTPLAVDPFAYTYSIRRQ